MQGQSPPAATPDADELTTWYRAGRHVAGGYFWYFAAVGAFSPFAALYYRSLDFSGFQLGVLSALPALCMALLAPLWGSLADSHSWHRRILRAALLLAALFALFASQANGFPLVFAAVTLMAIAATPIPSLLDAYAMTASERSGRPYGSLRVWGSIGYMGLTLGLPRLVGKDVTATYFVTYAMCLVLAVAMSFGLPALSERQPRPIVAGLRAAIAHRRLVLLLLVAYLLSCSTAIMYVFLGIRIRDLGGSTSLVGIAFALSALSELPIIAFGAWFLRRFGPFRMLAFALVVYGVRYIAFSSITDPVWILPVQLLHGLSYGIYLMASVTLAHRVAGRAQAATAQALLTAVSFGLGTITGSLVGGALLDSLGTAGLFRGAAVVVAITLAILLIGNRTIGLDGDAT